MNNLKHYVIYDLDNCISDDEHRVPLIDWSRSVEEGRYDAYHAACVLDKPNANSLDVLKEDLAAGLSPIFLTGRPLTHYERTCDWLLMHCGLYKEHYTLLMRKRDDHRPSVVIKRDMIADLDLYNIPTKQIVAAYDDREDIVKMYSDLGIQAHVLRIHSADAYAPPQQLQDFTPRSAADVLGEMAETFRERGKTYKDNFRVVGPVMKALHPDGVTLKTEKDHEFFHLYSLLIVKLTRFAISDLKHVDSIHDLCVYGAMLEALLQERPQ